MTAYRSCPSCECKIKVKDEFAGRKIKCPRCSTIFAVPKPEEAEEVDVVEEVNFSIPQRPARKEGQEERSRKKNRQDTEVDDEERPRKKKEKTSILHTDLTEAKRSVENFDVSRFTIVGWLLFVVSAAVAIVAFVLVEWNYESVMQIPQDQRFYTKYYVLPVAAAAVGGFGCFFGGLGALYLAGIEVIRPKPDAGDQGNPKAKRRRTRRT
jgi:transcription elongation factor Elf1